LVALGRGIKGETGGGKVGTLMKGDWLEPSLRRLTTIIPGQPMVGERVAGPGVDGQKTERGGTAGKNITNAAQRSLSISKILMISHKRQYPSMTVDASLGDVCWGNAMKKR